MKKRHYFSGFIGAFLGALVGSIPWILAYIFANLLVSILAILIAIFALKGYELFKGKMGNKLPWIIAGVSLLVMVFITLVVIPNIMIYREYGAISIANYKTVWNISEFRNSLLIHDLPLSLLFTILGIAGVISTIKLQINNDVEKIDLNYNPYKVNDSDRKKIKEAFLKSNAMSKENAIEKEALLNIMPDNIDNFNALVKEGIIKVKKDKYYYNEKMENPKRKYIIKILSIVFVLVVVGLGIFVKTNNNSKVNNNFNKIFNEVSYSEPSNYTIFELDEEIYPDSEFNWQYVPSQDISGKSGIIQISTFNNEEKYDNYEPVFENIKTSIVENGYKIEESKLYDNKVGNKVIYIKIALDKESELVYYVFKEDKVAFIDAFMSKNEKIAKDAKKIANTFDWK